MGLVAGIAMVGGAAFSAVGSYKAGKAQQKVADYNADVADVQAEDAIARGRIDEANQRRTTKYTIGSQRAAWGASGADVNSGNAVDVQADTAKFGEMDALTIRMNAAREAWGYKVNANSARMGGQVAANEGTMRAASTIVSAAGSYASKSYGFKSKG